MQTTFELGPEEWTDSFWKRIMPLFAKRKVRVTVEEVELEDSERQYDTYLALKKLQAEFPPIKIDPSIDLSKLADESNNTQI